MLALARSSAEWRPAIGLVVEPRSGAVVINGYEGTASLQFYDVHRDRHVLDLEMEPQWTLVKGAHFEFRVEAAAFSSDGTHLVTVCFHLCLCACVCMCMCAFVRVCVCVM